MRHVKISKDFTGQIDPVTSVATFSLMFFISIVFNVINEEFHRRAQFNEVFHSVIVFKDTVYSDFIKNRHKALSQGSDHLITKVTILTNAVF